MPTFDPIVPTYRYFTVDLMTNLVLSEVAFTGVSYELALKSAGSFSGSIPVLDATAAMSLYENTMPGRTALYVVRDGVCVWGGIIWSRAYAASTKSLSVNASEFTSYLHHRNIWKTYSHDYSATAVTTGGSGLTVVGLDYSTFPFSVGGPVKIEFYEVGNFQFNGYYTILSPGLSNSTFTVSVPGLADGVYANTTVRVRVDTYEYVRAILNEMNIDFSGTDFPNGDIEPSAGYSYSIVNKQLAASSATITTLLDHEFIAGQTVTIKNVDDTFNGDYTLASTTANTLTYVVPTLDTFLAATGGRQRATIPDSTATRLTGNVEIVMRFSIESMNSGDNVLLSKGYAGTYFLAININGIYLGTTTSTGVAFQIGSTNFSTAIYPLGTTRWLKVTRTTAGQVRFYHAPDQSYEPTAGQWSTFETASQTVSGALITNGVPVGIGADYGGSAPSNTKIYRAILRSSIGAATPVFDVDFTKVAIGTTSFTESSANALTVTLQSNANIVDGATQLALPGITGNYASTPDSAALDLVGTPSGSFLSTSGVSNYATSPSSSALNAAIGDLELVFRVRINSFTAAVDNALITRGYAGQFFVSIRSTNIYVDTGIVGTGRVGNPITYNIPVGTTMWLKVTRAQLSGDIYAYYAADQAAEPSAWTQIGTLGTPSAFTPPGNLIASTGVPCNVGPGTDANFYRAVVRSGIGGGATTVFDADFTKAAIGATSFAEQSSNAAQITLVGPAAKIVDGSTFLTLNGTTGNFVSIPDSSALDIQGTEGTHFLALFGVLGSASAPVTGAGTVLQITGDIEIVFRCNPYSLIANYTGCLTRDTCWRILIDGAVTSALRFGVWNGSNWTEITSSSGAFVVGTTRWYKVSRAATSGAVVISWAADSSTEPTTGWTVVSTGSTILPGTSLPTPVSELQIGTRDVGGYGFFDGNFYNVGIRSTIGGTTNVFSANFTSATIGASTSTDLTSGIVVTLNGSASKIVDGTTFLRLPGTSGYYASTPDNASLDILGVEGTHYLHAPGVAGNYASTPNNSVLNITGAIEMVGRCSGIPTSDGYLFLKGSSYATRSYSAVLRSTGALGFWSRDSAPAVKDLNSAAVLPYGATTRFWWKITADPVSGNVNFYHAADASAEPSTWTTLGGTQNAVFASGTFATNTDTLLIGNALDALVYRGIVRNGIGGTTVFDADFTIAPIGSSSFAPSTGQTVTLTGSATKIVDGTTFLTLPGITGNYASAPDPGVSGALDLVGCNIEIVFRIAADAYASVPTSPRIVSKLNGAAVATGGGYDLYLSNGAFNFQISNGTSSANVQSNPHSLAEGQAAWGRVTWATGSGAVAFYVAADSQTEPSLASWTAIGTSSTSVSATTIADNAIGVRIGNMTSLDRPFNGKIYRVILRNTTSSTTVLDADFTQQIQFATSFTERSTSAATVTIVGTGARIERLRDIEIVVRAALDNWAPGGTVGDRALLSKWFGGGGYYVVVAQNGALNLAVSFAGTDMYQVQSDAVLPSGTFTVNTAGWLKFTRSALTGNVNFYYAADSIAEPSSWTQLGSANRPGQSGSPVTSTAPLYIGSLDIGAFFAPGRFYRTIVRNGINGATVFDADFSRQIQFATSFTERSAMNAATVSLTGTGARIERQRDIEIVTRVALDNWSPSSGVNYALVGKWRTTGNQRSYMLYRSLNSLTLHLSPDGLPSFGSASVSTSAFTFVNGNAYWIKATKNTISGLTSFYIVADQTAEPTAGQWTAGAIGTATAAYRGGPHVSDSTATLEVGTIDNGTQYLSNGRHFKTIIRNGIGAAYPILDVDFTRQIQFSSTFYELSTNVGLATVNGPGARIERQRDIEVVFRVALDSYGANALNRRIFSKSASGNTQVAWNVIWGSSGRLEFWCARDGTTSTEYFYLYGPTSHPFVDGKAYWFRITRSRATGTLQYAADSATEPQSWTTLATTISGQGSIFNGTGLLAIGAHGDGSASAGSGKYLNLIVRNGIGSTAAKVFDADFTKQVAGAASFYEGSTNNALVTIYGGIQIVEGLRVRSTAISGVVVTVTKKELTENVATITTATDHGFSVGQRVEIAGVDNTASAYAIFNGSHEIVSIPTFSVSAVTPATPAGSVLYETTSAHSLIVGDTVVISGLVPVGYNGTFTVTAVSSVVPYTFTVVNATTTAVTDPVGSAIASRKFVYYPYVVSPDIALTVITGTATVFPQAVGGTYGSYPGYSDIGLQYSTSDYSQVRVSNKTYRGFELRSVGEELDQYSDMIDGFEYRIDCGYDVETDSFTRTFVFIPINYPNPPAVGQISPLSRYGADKFIFEYPGNINEVTIDESAENSATRFFVVGNIGDLGADASQPYAAATATDLLLAGWPILDLDETKQNEGDEAVLYAQAERYLDEFRPPVSDIKISINGSLSPIVGTYKPGNWCGVIVNDDFVKMRLASDLEPRDTIIVRKIENIKITVPDGVGFPERVEVLLIPEWKVDAIGK